MITRRSMLALTSAAAAMAVAGLGSRTASTAVRRDALFGHYPVGLEPLESAPPTLTPEMVRKAVAMLQENAVPPCEDGYYRLHTRGIDYRQYANRSVQS